MNEMEEEKKQRKKEGRLRPPCCRALDLTTSTRQRRRTGGFYPIEVKAIGMVSMRITLPTEKYSDIHMVQT